MSEKLPLTNTNAKIEALSMYLQGIKQEVIAKELRKTRQTIGNWKVKYNWDEHLRRLEEETRLKTFETNEARKDRMLKIHRAIQMTFAKDLREGNAEINAQSAIRSMEIEARLTGLDVQKIEISGDTPTDWIRELKEQEEEDALAKESISDSKE